MVFTPSDPENHVEQETLFSPFTDLDHFTARGIMSQRLQIEVAQPAWTVRKNLSKYVPQLSLVWYPFKKYSFALKDFIVVPHIGTKCIHICTSLTNWGCSFWRHKLICVCISFLLLLSLFDLLIINIVWTTSYSFHNLWIFFILLQTIFTLGFSRIHSAQACSLKKETKVQKHQAECYYPHRSTIWLK